MQSSLGNKQTTSYKCDTCLRMIKLVDINDGIGYLNKCTITQGCIGTIHPIINKTEQKLAKAIPPSVNRVQDWTQRKILFDYVQPFASREWLIVHNLDAFPNTYAYNRLNERVHPDKVEDIDQNTIKLIFKDAQVGTAQCVATSSKQVQVEEVVETDQRQSLTNGGTLTLATTSADPISILMTFEDTLTSNIIIVEYKDIPMQATVESPWIASKQVVISNRYYNVRSFNLRYDDETTELLNSGRLASGVRVTIDVGTTKVHDTLALLAKPPFTPFDRITDQYVDLAIPNSDIIFNRGELMIETSSQSVRSVYPPIMNSVKTI